MKQNFWQDLPRPFFILAPMEDVTDVVFRHVIAEAAPADVYFTEFTNTDSFVHEDGHASTSSRLLFTEDEQPIVAHIWGDNPEHFRQMSLALAERGFAGIDINMGCPAPNVYAHGRGAGLIHRPDVAASLIEASKAGGLPVSVKTRLGHKDVSEYKDWLSHILRQGIANLSIHLRTKVEMSKADAHYELIPEIKQLRDELAPNTLLTINGDIRDYQHGMELVTRYGVDGIMIGRGVFADPFAFEKNPREHGPDDLLKLLRHHLDLFDANCEIYPSRPFVPLRRYFKIYIREFRGASDLRNALMEAESTKEVRDLLDRFEREF